MKNKFTNGGERDAAYQPAFRALAPALLFLPDLRPSPNYSTLCITLVARTLGAHDDRLGVLGLDEFNEHLDGMYAELEKSWPVDEAVLHAGNAALGAIAEARKVAEGTPEFPR